MFSPFNKSDLEQKFHRSLNLVKLFFQNKDYQAAKTVIDELLETKPDSSEAYKLLSQINEALGENELAIQNYQKSLELKSMETNNLFNDYHFSPSKIKSITRLSGQIKNGPDKSQTTPSKGDEADTLKLIEKLIESKFGVLMNSIEYFKENFSQISNNCKEDILSLRQELKLIDQKISKISEKHEKFERTLFAKPSDSDLKNELKKISYTLEKLSLDVDKKFNELDEKIEKIQINPYSNEEEDYFDHYVDEENDIDENYECDKQDNCQQSYFGETEQQLPQLKDLFPKQKDNKWICQTCEVANDDNVVNCLCCETPRNPIQQQKNQSLFSSPPNQNSQFVFGFPPSNVGFSQFNSPAPPTVAKESSVAPKPILEKPLFSFNNAVSNLMKNSENNSGDVLTTNQPTSMFDFKEKPQPSSSLFGSNVPFDSSPFSKITPQPFSFGTPNAKTDSSLGFNFTNISNNAPVPSFQDSNKPKSPTTNVKAVGSIFSFDRSQQKNGIDLSKIQFNVSNEPKEHVETEVENDQNDSAELVLPKVNLPENYEHVTGEEDEQEVFNVQRAKLFILVGEEYKERGTGGFKILQDNSTKKLRLVMRRDQVHKVCLNIPLTPEIEFKNQNKFILFQCIDFSDNKPTPLTCLLKLRDADKMEFLKFIDDYVKNKSADGIVPTIRQADGKPESINSTDTAKGKDKSNKSEEKDIELIYEKPLKSEHKKIIEELKLPLNFFDYEEKPKCKGCIGCRVDDLDWNDLTYSTVQEDNQTSSANSLGFFSNFSTDVKTEKIDNLQFNTETTEEPISFVSEKSKLLPQNYKHTTGEEGEEVVYKERAKLYRFISESCEYKERGVGEIKILKKQDENNYRLLMRRDIVHKLICNHKIHPKLSFKNNDKSLTSLTWATVDFSENPAGENQIFLIKFKDEKRKKEFLDNIEKCVENLKT